MNKKEIYNFIKNKNIWYEVFTHKPVYNMEEVNEIDLPHKEYDAKNLFVRDDKKRNYYLITVKSDKKVDLKQFRYKYNTRALSFASSEELMKLLSLTPGSVTPLGLLNDNDLRVVFYLDKEFLEGEKIIAVHPNDNTATLFLKTEDLINIIREHGNQVILADICQQ